MTRLALIALIALIAPIVANAQDIAHLDTLKVTSTRGSHLAKMPAAISVVTHDQIHAARPGISLDEALLHVPGVAISNRYNFAQGVRIAMRGFGARAQFGVRGVRLIQDGIPLTMPDGQATLNNLELNSADRIEVLRGAASMLHGNAAGGVIEIHSETPSPGLHSELSATAGDYGRDRFYNLGKLNLKVAGGSERTRYLLSGSHINTDGFRDRSHFEQTNINARMERAHGARSHTSATLNYSTSPVAQDPGSLPADSARLKPYMAWPLNVAQGAGKSTRQLQGGIQHAREVGGGELTTVAYGLTRSLDNPQTFAYIKLDRKAGGMRSTLAWPHVTLGLDAEAMSDDRHEFNNAGGQPGPTQTRDQTDQVQNIGPFVRAQVDVATNISVTAGVRYDRTHFAVTDHFLADGRDDSGARTMSAFSPAAGVTWSVAPATTLYGNFSTSFQTPTTTEMINTPPAPGQPCCTAGFNALDPERATSFELGARAQWRHRINIDAAVYDMRIRDELVPFQVSSAPGRSFFRNAGRTSHRGIELSATAAVTRRLQLLTSYTYSHFVFQDDGQDAMHNEGNLLPGVPPHHLLTRVTTQLGKLFVEPEVEWTSSYFAADANTTASQNESYTLLNIRARTEAIGRAGVTAFVALNNLLDTHYNGSVVINAAGARYFEPAPGRNFIVGLALQVYYWHSHSPRK